MKICPFMSHMLGNEANVLEVGTADDDLGHDDSHGGVGIKSSARTGVKESKPAASHLYCLRDTCRFYRSKDGDCTFDAVVCTCADDSAGGGMFDCIQAAR